MTLIPYFSLSSHNSVFLDSISAFSSFLEIYLHNEFKPNVLPSAKGFVLISNDSSSFLNITLPKRLFNACLPHPYPSCFSKKSSLFTSIGSYNISLPSSLPSSFFTNVAFDAFVSTAGVIVAVFPSISTSVAFC